MASAGTRACFVCGSTDHLKRDCPSRSHQHPQGGDPRGRGRRRGRGGGRGRGRGGGGGQNPRSGSGQQVQAPSVSRDDCKSDEVYVDTHIHIDSVLEKMRKPFDELVKKYYPENFQYCVAIFSDSAAFSPSFRTWPDHLKSDQIFGAFGMHPHNAKYYSEQIEERIIECIQHEKAVAWGEIGLDFHYNRSPQDKQKEVFGQQCKMAVVYEKPVVIHSRKAAEDTINIMLENLPKDWRIHVHCFSDSVKHAKLLLETFPNLFIGITGAVTFSNAHELREVVKFLPLNRLLLETDGPWMAPGRRGQTCHSGHIPVIAGTIAQIKGVSIDEVFSQTRENTTKMYGI